MATFFSGEVVGYWATTPSNYIYGTLTGDVSRSGNTVTLSNMYLNVSFRYSAYGSGSYTFYVNGTPTTWTMDAASPSHSLNNTSFNVTASQTSATVSWTGSDGYAGTFSVSFPSGVVKPNTPTISTSVIDSHTIAVTWGTTSFGVPSTGTIYLYGDTSSTPTTQISSKTTTGNTTFTFSNLTPNTTYYFRSRATNGQLYSDYSYTVSAKTKVGNYVPVLGKSRPVQKYYVPLSEKSRKTLKLYDSINGKSRRIY